MNIYPSSSDNISEAVNCDQERIHGNSLGY